MTAPAAASVLPNAAESVPAVWRDWPPIKVPWRLSALIAEYDDGAEWEHRIRSVDAMLGAAGVPMSQCSTVAELAQLYKLLFGITTVKNEVVGIVNDLHDKAKALGKATRRKLKRENIARTMRWISRPLAARHSDLANVVEISTSGTGAGIPASVTTLRPDLAVEVREGDRLLGTILHQGGRLLALGPRGRRLGTFNSENSARRMIVATAGFRILDKDAEKRRAALLRNQPRQEAT
jgi:hypothetical protein